MHLARTLMRVGLGRRLSTHGGTLTVHGCHARIVIGRDAHGIPQITAQSDEDAWFGLGFCHGQDRAGQLEITLRAVRGTLAAVVGPDALGIDRLARRVGWRRAAVKQIAVAKGAVRAQLAAYARGVNAGTQKGGARVAHDLTLLGCAPTPWEAADVQGVCALLCFALASNWDMELVRLAILEQDGPAALHALDPTYPDDLPVTSPPDARAGTAAGRLAADLEAFSSIARTGGGSNAWVLAASRTRTGRPILANDPHLQPVLPCSFYLGRVSAPGWSAVGASFVGIPAVACGHNGFAAWGLTAAHGDNTDLFLEEIGPDGRSVREGDGFVACEARSETILVKGGDAVVEEVLETPRGPVVGPALGDGKRAISMSATWLAARPYEGFLGMHRVKSAEAMRACFVAGSTSGANVLYADVTGTIAWHFAMDLPVRKRGSGHLPLPGWDTRNGWEAEGVPPEARPFEIDPRAGFLASANNQPVPGDAAGPFLGVDWLDGYRQARIVEALSARSDWSVASTQALQMDTRSIAWSEMRDAVLATATNDPDARRAIGVLRDWDGNVASSSAAASIFELFVASMCERVVRAKAPRSFRAALGAGATKLLPHNLVTMRRMSHLSKLVRERPADFLPWDDAMSKALGGAVRTLRNTRGDAARWAWGDVRPVRLKHALGDKKPLDAIFNRGPFPGLGDAGTIPQGSVDPLDPLGNPIGVPVLRAVIDVGAWDESRFVILGGQAGNPLSPWYDDLIEPWQRGEGVPVAWSDEAVARSTTTTLTLEPA